jgi:hypothetical protein
MSHQTSKDMRLLYFKQRRKIREAMDEHTVCNLLFGYIRKPA